MQTKLFYHRLFAVLCLFMSLSCLSQNRLIEMTDPAGLRSLGLMKGDTVVVQLDSAYVMNKITFQLYQDTYRRVKRNDLTVKRLLEDYENLIALQDSMLRTKENYYQQLKMGFDSLAAGSNTFLTRTEGNITVINQSLTNATNQLTSIRGLLDSSLEKLKQESRLKFKMAVKGFAVGVGVASLIFLLTK